MNETSHGSIKPRYPVYVISKGRWGKEALTAQFLSSERCNFKLVVEPQEKDEYAKNFGAEQLHVLPFSNLGKGSIPARNWVWEHAKSEGHKRHWILDDNIRKVYRRWKGYRIPCEAAPAFAATEDFVDRYENIAIAGMNYTAFLPEGQRVTPFYLNVHVYSCLLILNKLPHRWRGRYNEDTDLCLQVLSDGWCTILMNAFTVHKTATMTMKGGNTDELYKGDGRLKMARSLERMWPGVVTTKRRFGRPQHVVKGSWGKFDNQLKLKPEVDLEKIEPNEYGMMLVKVDEIENPVVRKLYEKSHGR